MKNRKFLLMVAVMLGLSLSACGGNTTSKSEAPKSETPSVQPSSEETKPSSEEAKPSSETPKPSSEQPKPSSEQPKPSSEQPQPSSEAPQPSSETPQPSSEAPVKAVTVSSVDLVDKESKAYLQIKGTATEYTAAEFLWALALSSTNNQGTASDDFILGTSATFTEADYVLPATLNQDGTFLFEYNLSDIALMKAGLFTIHAGVKGLASNLDVGDVNDGVRVKDAVNRYYIRTDVGNKNTIAVDELPPVEFTEATIVIDENEVPWAKVGGEAAASVTQEVLDGYDSFVGLQSTNNWQETMRTKADNQYYWKLEGNKAYIYFDISFFSGSVYNAGNQSTAASFGGAGYNTHLNVKVNQQADLKMEAAIDDHYVIKNAEGKLLDVEIVAVPGASDQANFWGNLGFRANDMTEWNSEAIGTALTGGTITPKDFGNGVKGYKFNKTDISVNLSYAAPFATSDLIKANLKLLISVKLSNNEKTDFWKQIEGEAEGGTDKTSIKVNGVEMAHGEEIDFKAAGCTVGSGVTDSGELTVPVWIDIGDIDLTKVEETPNEIVISYLGGGYSYYLCAARIVYHS